MDYVSSSNNAERHIQVFKSSFDKLNDIGKEMVLLRTKNLCTVKLIRIHARIV